MPMQLSRRRNSRWMPIAFRGGTFGRWVAKIHQPHTPAFRSTLTLVPTALIISDVTETGEGRVDDFFKQSMRRRCTNRRFDADLRISAPRARRRAPETVSPLKIPKSPCVLFLVILCEPFPYLGTSPWSRGLKGSITHFPPVLVHAFAV